MTVTTTILTPRVDMPTADELARLRQIVLREHEWPPDAAPEREFPRAFYAAASLFRTQAPVSSVYFVHWTDVANSILTQQGWASISGSSLFAALLACGDVVWRAQDRSIGQPLEVGLHQYVGRRCEGQWRAILKGEATLLKRVPPLDRGVKPGLTVIRAGER
jgi:hypothetical protein